MNIELEIGAIIQREGGFSDHPADKGGPTRYGITEHEARANGYNGDMRYFPMDLAKAIYRGKYWLTPKFDKIAAKIPAVAGELFDTGVNMGPTRASTFLQRALNVLNMGITLYPNLVVDGQVGNMTLYAIDQLIAKRGIADGGKVLLRLLDSQQAVKYMEIAEANPSQEAFLYGWVLNRVG